MLGSLFANFFLMQTCLDAVSTGHKLCVYSHLQQLGLATAYQERGNTYNFIRKLLALYPSNHMSHRLLYISVLQERSNRF